MGSNSVEPACVDNAGDDRLAADQAQVDAATAAAFCLVGKDRERAACHEVKAADVDDEGSGRSDAGGRLPDQVTPGVLVARVDLAARV